MSSSPSPELVARIRENEEAAADAVPPAVARHHRGWRLRFNHGVKRRPNSVLANAYTGSALEADIAQAEAFYAEHGLRARFQLCPASQPAGLAKALVNRGYAEAPETVLVQVAAVRAAAPPEGVTLLRAPTEAWLALYCRTEGLEGAQALALAQMLGRLPQPATFALITQDGAPAAVGVGVVQGERVGLFNLATRPSARRQGLGSRVVAALCAWGARGGATEAYLQVSVDNAAAQRLYARAGFETLYAYRYLEQP